MDFMGLLSGGAMADMFKKPIDDMIALLSSIEKHMSEHSARLARIESHLGMVTNVVLPAPIEEIKDD
jgi:hypothetical protein